MMKSAGHEPRQPENAIRQQHSDRAAENNADQPNRLNPGNNKPQQNSRRAKGMEENELGPGSELDAVPPDANREPLPPDASIPKKSG
jgi:hypothetical protein